MGPLHNTTNALTAPVAQLGTRELPAPPVSAPEVMARRRARRLPRHPADRPASA